MKDPRIPPSHNENRVLSTLESLHIRHERLKRFVHEGFRYPLPKWGRNVMAFVYFTIPVVGGWYVMQWAIGKSHSSIGVNGERLPVKTISGIGDKRGSDGQHVGAGGWGGGVRLVVSDTETQIKNKQKMDEFVEQLRKK